MGLLRVNKRSLLPFERTLSLHLRPKPDHKALSHTGIKNMFIFNEPRFCRTHGGAQSWMQSSLSAWALAEGPGGVCPVSREPQALLHGNWHRAGASGKGISYLKKKTHLGALFYPSCGPPARLPLYLHQDREKAAAIRGQRQYRVAPLKTWHRPIQLPQDGRHSDVRCPLHQYGRCFEVRGEAGLKGHSLLSLSCPTFGSKV